MSSREAGTARSVASKATATGPDGVQVGRLRSAALAYVEVGWPIVALAPAGDQVVSWMSPGDVVEAAEWWSDRPYGIGVRTGEAFDVAEVSTTAGELLLAELRQRLRLPVPVFEIPRRGWLFPVTPGAQLIAELVLLGRRLRLHQRGGWVPVPPTPLLGGPVAWISRGTVPHSVTVQQAAFQVLRGTDMFGDQT